MTETPKIVATAHGLGLTVAIDSSGRLSSSTDNIHWTQRMSPDGSAFYTAINFRESCGVFLTVGRKGALATSTDGVMWTARYRPIKGDVTLSRAPNGDFVISDGATELQSEDGVDWKPRDT